MISAVEIGRSTVRSIAATISGCAAPEWLIDIYKHRYARTLAVASVIVTITIDAATMVREIYKYRGLRACSHAVDHYFEQTIGVCEGVVVVGNYLRGKIIKVCGIGECSLDICGCENAGGCPNND